MKNKNKLEEMILAESDELYKLTDYSKEFDRTHRGILRTDGEDSFYQCSICGNTITTFECNKYKHIALGYEFLSREYLANDPKYSNEENKQIYSELVAKCKKDLMLFCSIECFAQFKLVLNRIDENFKCIRYSKNNGLLVSPKIMLEELLDAYSAREQDVFTKQKEGLTMMGIKIDNNYIRLKKKKEK